MWIPITALLWCAPIDVMPGDDLKAVLSNLQPGDVVTIHGGTYGPMGFTDFQWNGTQADPIVVQGADGEAVIIQGDSSQNTMNIQGSDWTLRNVTIEGGSHGLRLGTSVRGTVEDVVIHDVDDVGLSCNRDGHTYEAMVIRGVEIYNTGVGGGTGEAMYLGCNDDKCQMWDSIVEWNYCHHTTAGSQGDGIELKTGSYNNVVRHNVIHDVKYPALTFYGTVGGKAPNVVEGNVVWNVGDNGIQVVGDVIVRNNIVFATGANGIHAKPSQGEDVASLRIVHNTVYVPGGTCLKGNDWGQGAGDIVVAGNLLLCEGGQAVNLVGGDGGATLSGNGVVGGVAGAGAGFNDLGAVAAAVVDAAGMDFYPVDGGAAVGAADGTYAPVEDFDCQPRDDGAPDMGAYEWRAPGTPGWPIQEGFKTCVGGGGGDTGGSTGGGSSGGGGDSGGGVTTGGPGGTTGGGGTTASGSGTSGAGTSGGGTSGTGGAGAGSDGAGGCGCRSQGRGHGAAGLAWLLLSGAIGRRRRASDR